MTKTVLILGAQSDIGQSVGKRFAEAGYNLQLAARSCERLVETKLDLEIRFGIGVTLHEFDVLDTISHEKFIKNLPVLPEVSICSVGLMEEQEKLQIDIRKANLVIRTNFEGPASILSALANHYEQKGSGALVGISSVAGDRGRSSNYLYGSSKSGLTAFLSGLRNRLHGKGIRVITVLPGFVNTKMTSHLNLPSLLTAEPDHVGEAIYTSVVKGYDIIYVKPIWRYIMLLIRAIPERFFKKLNI